MPHGSFLRPKMSHHCVVSERGKSILICISLVIDKARHHFMSVDDIFFWDVFVHILCLWPWTSDSSSVTCYSFADVFSQPIPFFVFSIEFVYHFLGQIEYLIIIYTSLFFFLSPEFPIMLRKTSLILHCKIFFCIFLEFL